MKNIFKMIDQALFNENQDNATYGDILEGRSMSKDKILNNICNRSEMDIYNNISDMDKQRLINGSLNRNILELKQQLNKQVPGIIGGANQIF